MSDNDLFDLDTDLDEINDIAQFVNPHNGTHVFGIIFAGMDKVGSEKTGVKIVYQMVAHLEISNDDEPVAPIGSIFAESFTGNEKGLEILKLRLKQFFGDDISGKIGPYIQGLNEKFRQEAMVQMTTVTKTTKGKDKEGNSREYENVRILSAEAVEPITLPDGFEWAEYKSRLDSDD